MRAVLLGILASFFFAVTFVLNRKMNLAGGSWIWSASLRYLFMVPFLLAIVLARRNLGGLLCEMRNRPLRWLGWSFVGFVLFYAPLCFASAYGPAWLIAGTWQLTIIAGSLLVPFFYTTVDTPDGPRKVRQQIPIKGLLFSSIILLGIALMQVQEVDHVSAGILLLSILPVLLAAFAYPLGNRKMMEVCEGRLDAYQRVLGMTLASLPFWIILSAYGWITAGRPDEGQVAQSVIVAISSGVIATVLFFAATDSAKGNIHHLAVVEATQAGEVVFSLLGEIWLLSGRLPSGLSLTGMGIVVVGMILHSLYSHRPAKKKQLSGNRATSL
ncbi:DMT family transporter [Aneurinibacillus terranovensis]|uniref:DMT family transporter n=1 Tax=Aneurinibacillus terranovensis TaxID=278991 RepID=UPI000426878B|nr:multidrug resistance efflux transporter family protein [Aneurinibacillus terranovensis]